MQKHIHIAIGSTTSKPGEVSGNLQQIADFAHRAGDDGVHLLLTPELSASGYGGYPEVLATAEVAGDGPIYQRLAELAQETGVVLCAGFVEASDTKRYLAHYVVYPDGAFVLHRKHRVTPVERPLDSPVALAPQDEHDYIGQPVGVVTFNYFTVQGVRCGLAICADAGIPGLNEIFARNGVELLLGPTGAGGRRDDRVTTADLYTAAGRQAYLAALQTVFFPGGGVSDCQAYGRALAAVNMCGYDGQQHYHVGHGMIINPLGEVLGFFHGLPNLDRQRPMYAHAEIDIAARLYAPEEAINHHMEPQTIA